MEIKKILFVWPTTLGSACLDTNISSVAQDSLALAEIFENNGYEVWLYCPYKRKKSSWPRQVKLEDISKWEGEVCFFAQQGHLRQLNGQSIRPIKSDVRFQKVLESLYYLFKNGAQFWIPIFDVKTSFFTPPISENQFRYDINPDRGDEYLYEDYAIICLNSNLIFPDEQSAKLICKELEIDDYHNGVYQMNIFDHTHKYLEIPITLKPTLYDFIYTGYALTDYRKGRLKHFFNNKNDLNLGQAGSIRIAKKLNFKSLSNHKQISHKDNLELLNRSRFQLIFGEPTNTFLTPRFFMSLLGDSLTFVDSEYKAATNWCYNNGFANRVVSDLDQLVKVYTELLPNKHKFSSIEKQTALKFLNNKPYTFKEITL